MSYESLRNQLGSPHDSLSSVHDTVIGVLRMLERDDEIKERNSTSQVYSKYKFFYREMAPRELISRPVNTELFIENRNSFREKFGEFLEVLEDSRESGGTREERKLVNSMAYTMGAGFGVGADFVMGPNEARKNVGERFGNIISAIFGNMEVEFSSEARPYGKSRIDLVLSPYPQVKSKGEYVDNDELMCSIKTTSKDRFKHIFSDKEDLESVTGKEIAWIALFLYDVQRSGKSGVAKTFVPGRFLNKHSTCPLAGVYYIDPPRDYQNQKFDGKIKKFDRLVFDDLWGLL